jgi:hypothetical protein
MLGWTVMLACRNTAWSAASVLAFEARQRYWPGLIVAVPYVAVGPMPTWTVGDHVMRCGDGVGAAVAVAVATLGSKAGSCTGTVEGASVGEGTENVAAAGIGATLRNVAGGGASLGSVEAMA